MPSSQRALVPARVLLEAAVDSRSLKCTDAAASGGLGAAGKTDGALEGESPGGEIQGLV